MYILINMHISNSHVYMCACSSCVCACVCAYVRVCVCPHAHVCVCVRARARTRERQWERESVLMCVRCNRPVCGVCLYAHTRICVCVCVYVRARGRASEFERVCLSVCTLIDLYAACVCMFARTFVCVCVCACVRAHERQSESERVCWWVCTVTDLYAAIELEAFNVKSANICVSVLYIHESYERIHTHLSLSSFIYRSVYLIIYIHIYYFILFSLAKVHESLKRGRVTDFTSAASRCSSAVNTCMSVEEQVSAFVICSPMTLPSCHCPPLLWSDPVGVRRLRG